MSGALQTYISELGGNMSVVPTQTSQYILIAIGATVQEAQNNQVNFEAVREHIRRLEKKYPLYEIKVADIPFNQSPVLADLRELEFCGNIRLCMERQEIIITDYGILTFWSLYLP